MEAYVSVYQEKKEVEQLDENVQDAVKGALEKGADFMKTNPVGQAIGRVIGPVGKGKNTPTKADQDKKIKAYESVELYNIILEYLVSEGYADTNEAALVIMGNMSEEWRQSIVESQEARNNPEKYKEDQEKGKSKRQKAMEDPDTGINSPAFAAFMRKMGV
jgi:hypothetical protein